MNNNIEISLDPEIVDFAPYQIKMINESCKNIEKYGYVIVTENGETFKVGCSE